MTAARRAWWLPHAAIIGAAAIALGLVAYERGWRTLFLTPNQRGRVLMQAERPAAAAQAFRDPVWRGAALFRAGDFKGAAEAFAGADTAIGNYDQGNALIMLGKYDDAVQRFDRALALRPDWADARVNREIARLRGLRLKAQPGQPADATEMDEPPGPDELPPRDGRQDQAPEDAPPADADAMSDEAVRAMWLRRVQTRPADFLRMKFAVQLRPAIPEAGEGKQGGGR